MQQKSDVLGHSSYDTVSEKKQSLLREEQQAKHDRYVEIMVNKPFLLYGRVFIIAALSLVVCAGLGYYLDTLFITGHMYLFIGCGIGFLMAHLLVWLFVRTMLK